ncbi:uncharacterized protein LOC142539037 [Primulina tabacum]|uniref:uncharacterized protein LOC142539037 n=1 Tax=Primulina tabacum TaxID=48773 RepID=UPI003F59928F
MNSLFFPILFLSFCTLIYVVIGYGHGSTCRSFCGNLTVDYPFALRPGCGHSGFRELLFCINNVLMLHISSGSYRVLDIDYAYGTLVLHDPHMSTCDSLAWGGRGNGFVVEPWRAVHLIPTSDNVFMLLGCSAHSPLFQGLSCQNVSGLGCDEYYGCPAWDMFGPRQLGPAYGSGPPDCCATSLKAVNLSGLDCQGYSSTYSLAPLKVGGPREWAYGIQVKYYLQGNASFCWSCEATGGSCGYDIDKNTDVCTCGGWNSTTNCDSVYSAASHRKIWHSNVALAVYLMRIIIRRN